MKRFKWISWVLMIGLLVAACGSVAGEPTSYPATGQPLNPTTQSLTVSRTSTQKPHPSDTTQPRPTWKPTTTPTLTPSATPVVTINLDRFDPDLHPAIDVSHKSTELAFLDEAVPLAFDFACGYKFEPPGFACNYEVTLFYTYGESNDFTALPLRKAVQDEVEDWTAQLPAADAGGSSVHYDLQVYDP
jgi:hypothetical protein